MNRHQGLSDGDVISNKAYIYFDYNAPVITNDAFVTLDESLSNHTILSYDRAIDLYPNPVSSTLYVNAPNRFNVSWSVINVFGQQLITGSTNALGVATVNVMPLGDGLYFFKIGSTARKFA